MTHGNDMVNLQRDWLRSHLARFVPHGRRETQDHARMFDLLDAPGNPFARDHFAPGHFTASAFVLCPRGEALLLILHGKLHRWLQPGGHVDATDANLIEAARREVREETGLADLRIITDSIFDLDIHPIPANARKAEPAHEHFDVRFLFTAPHQEAIAASDAHAVRWAPIHSLSEAECDASVMRAIAKIDSSQVLR